SHFAPEWFNPSNWFRSSAYRDLRWSVNLNPSTPTDLDIHGGIGRSRIDLNRFDLTALDVTSGVGEMDITLPAKADSLEARLQVGVGKLDVTIPADANLYATIKGGVGETSITLPADAAARIEASSGIGELSMSSRFQKLDGTSAGIGPRGV